MRKLKSVFWSYKNWISKKADEAEMNRRLTELLDMVQSLADSNSASYGGPCWIRAVLDAIKETQRDFKDEMEQRCCR